MARKKVDSGASFVVTGTVLEKSDNQHLMREFAEAIHTKLPKKGGT
jgi:heptaprenylglyceryl phosphate synthase